MSGTQQPLAPVFKVLVQKPGEHHPHSVSARTLSELRLRVAGFAPEGSALCTGDGAPMTDTAFAELIARRGGAQTVLVRPAPDAQFVTPFSEDVAHEPRPAMFFETGENYLRVEFGKPPLPFALAEFVDNALQVEGSSAIRVLFARDALGRVRAMGVWNDGPGMDRDMLRAWATPGMSVYERGLTYKRAESAADAAAGFAFRQISEFGMGSKLAGFKLGKKLEVVTRPASTADGQMLHMLIDKEQKMKAAKQDEQIWTARIDHAPHGTRFGSEFSQALQEALLSRVGPESLFSLFIIDDVDQESLRLPQPLLDSMPPGSVTPATFLPYLVKWIAAELADVYFYYHFRLVPGIFSRNTSLCELGIWKVIEDFEPQSKKELRVAKGMILFGRPHPDEMLKAATTFTGDKALVPMRCVQPLLSARTLERARDAEEGKIRSARLSEKAQLLHPVPKMNISLQLLGEEGSALRLMKRGSLEKSIWEQSHPVKFLWQSSLKVGSADAPFQCIMFYFNSKSIAETTPYDPVFGEEYDKKYPIRTFWEGRLIPFTRLELPEWMADEIKAAKLPPTRIRGTLFFDHTVKPRWCKQSLDSDIATAFHSLLPSTARKYFVSWLRDCHNEDDDFEFSPPEPAAQIASVKCGRLTLSVGSRVRFLCQNTTRLGRVLGFKRANEDNPELVTIQPEPAELFEPLDAPLVDVFSKHFEALRERPVANFDADWDRELEAFRNKLPRSMRVEFGDRVFVSGEHSDPVELAAGEKGPAFLIQVLTGEGVPVTNRSGGFKCGLRFNEKPFFNGKLNVRQETQMPGAEPRIQEHKQAGAWTSAAVSPAESPAPRGKGRKKSTSTGNGKITAFASEYTHFEKAGELTMVFSAIDVDGKEGKSIEVEPVTIVLRVTPGPPISIKFEAPPRSVAVGDEVELAATVHDRFGNQVSLSDLVRISEHLSLTSPHVVLTSVKRKIRDSKLLFRFSIQQTIQELEEKERASVKIEVVSEGGAEIFGEQTDVMLVSGAFSRIVNKEPSVLEFVHHEKARLVLAAEDHWGNPARGYSGKGTVTISAEHRKEFRFKSGRAVIEFDMDLGERISKRKEHVLEFNLEGMDTFPLHVVVNPSKKPFGFELHVPDDIEVHHSEGSDLHRVSVVAETTFHVRAVLVDEARRPIVGAPITIFMPDDTKLEQCEFDAVAPSVASASSRYGLKCKLPDSRKFFNETLQVLALQGKPHMWMFKTSGDISFVNGGRLTAPVHIELQDEHRNAIKPIPAKFKPRISLESDDPEVRISEDGCTVEGLRGRVPTVNGPIGSTVTITAESEGIESARLIVPLISGVAEKLVFEPLPSVHSHEVIEAIDVHAEDTFGNPVSVPCRTAKLESNGQPALCDPTATPIPDSKSFRFCNVVVLGRPGEDLVLKANLGALSSALAKKKIRPSNAVVGMTISGPDRVSAGELFPQFRVTLETEDGEPLPEDASDAIVASCDGFELVVAREGSTNHFTVEKKERGEVGRAEKLVLRCIYAERRDRYARWCQLAQRRESADLSAVHTTAVVPDAPLAIELIGMQRDISLLNPNLFHEKGFAVVADRFGNICSNVPNFELSLNCSTVSIAPTLIPVIEGKAVISSVKAIPGIGTSEQEHVLHAIATIPGGATLHAKFEFKYHNDASEQKVASAESELAALRQQIAPSLEAVMRQIRKIPETLMPKVPESEILRMLEHGNFNVATELLAHIQSAQSRAETTSIFASQQLETMRRTVSESGAPAKRERSQQSQPGDIGHVVDLAWASSELDAMLISELIRGRISAFIVTNTVRYSELAQAGVAGVMLLEGITRGFNPGREDLIRRHLQGLRSIGNTRLAVDFLSFSTAQHRTIFQSLLRGAVVADTLEHALAVWNSLNSQNMQTAVISRDFHYLSADSFHNNFNSQFAFRQRWRIAWKPQLAQELYRAATEAEKARNTALAMHAIKDDVAQQLVDLRDLIEQVSSMQQRLALLRDARHKQQAPSMPPTEAPPAKRRK